GARVPGSAGADSGRPVPGPAIVRVRDRFRPDCFAAPGRVPARRPAAVRPERSRAAGRPSAREARAWVWARPWALAWPPPAWAWAPRPPGWPRVPARPAAGAASAWVVAPPRAPARSAWPPVPAAPPAGAA